MKKIEGIVDDEYFRPSQVIAIVFGPDASVGYIGFQTLSCATLPTVDVGVWGELLHSARKIHANIYIHDAQMRDSFRRLFSTIGV